MSNNTLIKSYICQDTGDGVEWYPPEKNDVFLVEENDSYQELFQDEKYRSYPNLSHFEILKINTITLHAQTLIVIPRKSTSNYPTFSR